VPIPQETIDEIQAKIDIVDVISGRIPLKKIGRSFKALCPFHHEKTPSFIVSPDKQIYHCFGCGAGGNAFSFLMKYDNLEFPEAVEQLAEKAGVTLPRHASAKDESSLSNQLYKINELACGFFQQTLANNSSAREYLISRGMGDETLKNFRIGYAPNAWDALLSFFKNKGFSGAVLEKAGLVIANDKGGWYDRFRNRIIFPISDLKQRILGFGGRVLDVSLPKYINSPETHIYSKGKNLYGLNFSKEYIRKSGFCLIVEGYLDYVIPYQAGIRSLIATLGTALTVEQVKLLKRFTQTVITVYDPDEAGEAASFKALDLFLDEGVNIYIAELTAGYDPDSYIRKFGAEEFKDLIKKSKNLFDYKLEKLERRFDITSANGKTRIAGEMLPTIARIKNAVLKSNLVKRLSERLSVDEESVREEMRKVKLDYGESRYLVKIGSSGKNVVSAEKMLLALLIESGDYVEKIKQALSLEEFKASSIRDIVKAVFDLREKGKELSVSSLINYLGNRPEEAVLISEAVSILETVTDRKKVIDDCIMRIKKDNLNDQLGRLKEAIKAAHEQKDENGVNSLINQYDTLLRGARH